MDFVFAHSSADVPALTVALVRGAFEFQGQNARRLGLHPQKHLAGAKERLIATDRGTDNWRCPGFHQLHGAVIDRSAFNRSCLTSNAKQSPEAEILVVGTYDYSVGYFIDPTIVVTTNPKMKLMEEEIFGPVLTIYVYEDDKLAETLELCDKTSPYGLTGAIFAQDRRAIVYMTDALREAAGNFYINDKPTGAVVGQQPFGGARASGTNDKAGSMFNLLRWVSQRAIKENLLPPTCYRYPHLDEE